VSVPPGAVDIIPNEGTWTSITGVTNHRGVMSRMVYSDWTFTGSGTMDVKLTTYMNTRQHIKMTMMPAFSDCWKFVRIADFGTKIKAYEYAISIHFTYHVAIVHRHVHRTISYTGYVATNLGMTAINGVFAPSTFPVHITMTAVTQLDDIMYDSGAFAQWIDAPGASESRGYWSAGLVHSLIMRHSEESGVHTYDFCGARFYLGVNYSVEDCDSEYKFLNLCLSGDDIAVYDDNEACDELEFVGQKRGRRHYTGLSDIRSLCDGECTCTIDHAHVSECKLTDDEMFLLHSYKTVLSCKYRSRKWRKMSSS
jgi:hypothetical protein